MFNKSFIDSTDFQLESTINLIKDISEKIVQKKTGFQSIVVFLKTKEI